MHLGVCVGQETSNLLMVALHVVFQGYTASPIGRLLEGEKLHTTQEGTAKK